MNVVTAIEAMHAAGFVLAAMGGRLSVSPAEGLSEKQRAFIRDHKTEILECLRESEAILDAGQPGDDLAAHPIMVEAWTPAGSRLAVQADSPEHAEWIRRMNPRKQS